jgi:hypothetical protein
MCDFMIIIAIICSYALGGQFYQSKNFFNIFIQKKKKHLIYSFCIFYILFYFLTKTIKIRDKIK